MDTTENNGCANNDESQQQNNNESQQQAMSDNEPVPLSLDNLLANMFITMLRMGSRPPDPSEMAELMSRYYPNASFSFVEHNRHRTGVDTMNQNSASVNYPANVQHQNASTTQNSTPVAATPVKNGTAVTSSCIPDCVRE